MDNSDSKLKNPDNSHSDPCSKPGIEDMDRNSEVLQDQETPPRATQYSDKKARALSPDGQLDPSEAPSKKMKGTDHFLFMDATEAATTPEETQDKQKITDTVSEIDTYTSLDNGAKQDNIFPSATQQNLDHNKDKFSVENEVSGIKMSIEQDLPAALNTSDSDTEKEANLSQTETADIVMNPPDAVLDHQSSSDASSSAAEANNKSVITSENRLQEIVVSETRDTKPIIDEQPEEDNHTSPAERREITRSTSSKVSHTESPEQCTQRAIAWPKDGHKTSLKGECKTPHNDRTSAQICKNRKDIVNLPTDSDTETEANLEKQIMNPEPPETANNESDLDHDEARAQYNSFLPETTVSRRRILPFRFCFIGIIGFIGIIVCIILVFVFILQ